MEANSNGTIVRNTIILYSRLLINTLSSLFATRFALKALGVSDFGLFSVIACIISFIAVLNTIMISTSNRFIATAIGIGDKEDINRQFNINLMVHVAIAVFTLIFALPIGDWYILNYINFDGDINIARKIFYFSVVGSVISFVGVPYNGLLIAKENFLVFCLTDAISHILKAVIAFVLIYYFDNKLIIYGAALAFFSAYPTFVYMAYCKKVYPDIVSFRLVKGWNNYNPVVKFSAWVGFGAIASIGKNQGAALLVNLFFNTVMNTALSVANTVNGMVTLFTENVTKPIAPQITKSFAAGDYERSYHLLDLSTKFSYYTMLIVATPFLLCTNWILKLWLGDVPDYAVMFTKLIVIDAIITSLYTSISNIIFASGKIVGYQLVVNVLRFMAIIAAYFVLKSGFPAYSLLYSYIVFSIIIVICVLVVLKKTLDCDVMRFVKNAYLPGFAVTLLFLPMFLLIGKVHPFLLLLLSETYLLLGILFIGLTKNERLYFKKMFRKLIRK